jgi:RNA polymerase sigma factor (sigma-70 family)
MCNDKMENPALGAPGSNNYSGLIATSTSQSLGASAHKVQVLSDEEAAKFSLSYRPLAFAIAGQYRNKGKDDEDLRSAALLGLVKASKKFDPDRGVPFGGYVAHWIKGEITALFKPTGDALSFGRAVSLNAPITIKGEEEEAEFLDLVADECTPAVSPDLSSLSERERLVVEARLRGETLREIGTDLGVSAERVRQLEARALPKIKGANAAKAISDLTRRGGSNVVSRFPVERTRRWEEFKDREPLKHVYRDPKRSRELTRHRVLAVPLATMRGGEPLRNPNGPYGGPVIHAWGSK